MSASSFIGHLPLSFLGMSSYVRVLDSRASHHMSLDSSSFVYICHSSFISIMTVDGTPMLLACVGYVVMPSLSFPNVYHFLKLTLNLTFVGQLCDSDNLVTFSYVHNIQSQKLIGTYHRHGTLYVLDELKVPIAAATSFDLSSFRLKSFLF